VATRAENIQTRLDAIALELATMTWGPNVTVDGVSVDNTGYRKSLLEEQTLLVQALVVAQGPFAVVSVAR
jgi:hypothetical protein